GKKGLRWSVAGHDLERRAAVEDMDKLVSLHVAFPGALSGKLAGEEGAVAIGRQLRGVADAIGARRLRRAATQHCQFGQLSVEIDDDRHVPLSLSDETFRNDHSAN